MQFISTDQKNFYQDHADIIARGDDYKALVYTVGINEECRNHFTSMFDSVENCIIPSAVFAGWQTGSSIRVTRLAFYLFTYHVPDGDVEDYYLPKALLPYDAMGRKGALLALSYFA